MPEKPNERSNQNNPNDLGSRKRYLTFGAAKNYSDMHASNSDTDAAVDDAPWQLLSQGWALHEKQLGPKANQRTEQGSPYLPSFSPITNSEESGGDLADLFHKELRPDWRLDPLDLGRPMSKDVGFEGDREHKGISIENPLLRSDQPHEAQWEEQVLDMSFYLVPRNESHHLVGVLSRQLRSWMRWVCKKYGWELIALSVRPSYFKWTLGDFPESLIQVMLRLIRKETSNRIINLFSEYKKEMDGVDYWAPGYLVDMHNREFTTQVLMAHIDHNRLNVKKENSN